MDTTTHTGIQRNIDKTTTQWVG